MLYLFVAHALNGHETMVCGRRIIYRIFHYHPVMYAVFACWHFVYLHFFWLARFLEVFAHFLCGCWFLLIMYSYSFLIGTTNSDSPSVSKCQNFMWCEYYICICVQENIALVRRSHPFIHLRLAGTAVTTHTGVWISEQSRYPGEWRFVNNYRRPIICYFWLLSTATRFRNGLTPGAIFITLDS